MDLNELIAPSKLQRRRKHSSMDLENAHTTVTGFVRTLLKGGSSDDQITDILRGQVPILIDWQVVQKRTAKIAKEAGYNSK